jgi:hypothetical protein
LPGRSRRKLPSDSDNSKAIRESNVSLSVYLVVDRAKTGSFGHGW